MTGDSKTKNLAIVGISGRMGAELRALSADFGFRVVAGVSRSAASLQASPEFRGLALVATVEELDSSAVDLVIDFSLPENTARVARWCAHHRKPLISGVTGIGSSEKAALTEASRSSAVLWAPNMSLGIAVLTRMLAQLSALDDFEFQIEELHHKRKKDAPSGTALFLQENLEAAVGTAPSPVAIRGGGIFGIHRVWAMGEEETLTLEHNAMNRRVFARGALRAAKWIMDRPCGFYRMDDVLFSAETSRS